ncbi:hypothetical protein BGZ74_003017 [Mortierella antarctica]|nr:hypothetical protein BGZ74_003017 [Mortierella antarctica]
MKLPPICAVASIAPLLLQTACATAMIRPQPLQKREVVYVTVTEIRYVPMAMPTQAALPASVQPVHQASQVQPHASYFTIPPYHPQVFAPPANTPASAQVIAPPVNIPAPVPAIAPARMPVALGSIPSTANPPPAAWTPPPANALTFTSHAGLLTTAEPGFYLAQLATSPPAPVSTSAPAPSPAQSNPPPQGVSVAPSPVDTLRWTSLAPAPSVANLLPSSQLPRSPFPAPLPILLPASSVHLSSPTPTSASLPVSPTPAATPTSPADRPTSPASTASASHTHSAESSLSSASRSLTTNDDKTASEVTLDKTTTTGATVSTTTTTKGSTFRTTTSVGRDGTTTVLTEYPTSTRHVQSTSGAHPKWTRSTMQGPAVGSTLGHLSMLLIPASFLSVVVITMVLGLAGVLFVL